MAANFDSAKKHRRQKVNILPTAEELPLSERQKENRSKYADVYDVIKHKYPGGMNRFERHYSYQIPMFLVFLCLGIAQLRVNSLIIDLYSDTLSDLRALPDPSDIAQSVKDDLLAQLSNLESTEGFCDIDHFVNSFDKGELEDGLKNMRTLLQVSFYFMVCFGFWVIALVKAMSAYNTCTEDFNVTPTKELENKRKSAERNIALEQEDHLNADKVVNPADVIRTKGHRMRNQETEGELKIRTYLRSETVLFGFMQLVQDIPFATGSLLYLLFLLRERGVLCYEAFASESELSRIGSLDNADGVVFLQLSLILLNVFFNMVVNLGPRWIAFFNHRTVKNSARPASTLVRLFNICLAVTAYLVGILLPLFIVLYSPVGSDLIGVNTTNSIGILVLLVFSGMALSVGSYFFCCHWGASCGEGLCVFATVLSAFEFGCEGCFEIEIFEMCQEGCCFC